MCCFIVFEFGILHKMDDDKVNIVAAAAAAEHPFPIVSSSRV